MSDCNEPFSGQHGSEGQTHVCDRAHRVSERYLTSGAERTGITIQGGNLTSARDSLHTHSIHNRPPICSTIFYIECRDWYWFLCCLCTFGGTVLQLAAQSSDWTEKLLFFYMIHFFKTQNQVRKCSLWCDVLSGVPATVTPCFYPPCLFFWCDSSQLYLFSSSRCLSCVSLSKFCVNVYVQWLTTLGGLTVCHLLFSLSFFLSSHISFSILASAWHSRPLGLPGHWDFSRCSWWPLQACLTCFHPLP